MKIRPAKIAKARQLIRDPAYPGQTILLIAENLAKLDALTEASFPSGKHRRGQKPPVLSFSSKPCPGCGDAIPSENSLCYGCENGG